MAPQPTQNLKKLAVQRLPGFAAVTTLAKFFLSSRSTNHQSLQLDTEVAQAARDIVDTIFSNSPDISHAPQSFDLTSSQSLTATVLATVGSEVAAALSGSLDQYTWLTIGHCAAWIAYLTYRSFAHESAEPESSSDAPSFEITCPAVIPTLGNSDSVYGNAVLKQSLDQACRAVRQYYYTGGTEATFLKRLSAINTDLASREAGEVNYTICSEYFQSIYTESRSIAEDLFHLAAQDLDQANNLSALASCGARLRTLQAIVDRDAAQRGIISDLIFSTPRFLAQGFDEVTSVIILRHLGYFLQPKKKPQRGSEYLFELVKRFGASKHWDSFEKQIEFFEKEAIALGKSSKLLSTGGAAALLPTHILASHSNNIITSPNEMSMAGSFPDFDESESSKRGAKQEQKLSKKQKKAQEREEIEARVRAAEELKRQRKEASKRQKKERKESEARQRAAEELEKQERKNAQDTARALRAESRSEASRPPSPVVRKFAEREPLDDDATDKQVHDGANSPTRLSYITSSDEAQQTTDVEYPKLSPILEVSSSALPDHLWAKFIQNPFRSPSIKEEDLEDMEGEQVKGKQVEGREVEENQVEEKQIEGKNSKSKGKRKVSFKKQVAMETDDEKTDINTSLSSTTTTDTTTDSDSSSDSDSDSDSDSSSDSDIEGNPGSGTQHESATTQSSVVARKGFVPVGRLLQGSFPSIFASGEPRVVGWNWVGGIAKRVCVEYRVNRAVTGRVESGTSHSFEARRKNNIEANNPIETFRDKYGRISKTKFEREDLQLGTVFWDARQARDEHEVLEILRPSRSTTTTYPTTYVNVYFGDLQKAILVPRHRLPYLLRTDVFRVATIIYKLAVKQEARVAKANGLRPLKPPPYVHKQENVFALRQRRRKLRRLTESNQNDSSDSDSEDDYDDRPGRAARRSRSRRRSLSRRREDTSESDSESSQSTSTDDSSDTSGTSYSRRNKRVNKHYREQRNNSRDRRAEQQREKAQKERERLKARKRREKEKEKEKKQKEKTQRAKVKAKEKEAQRKYREKLEKKAKTKKR